MSLPTLDSILALFPDNATGEVSAADVRSAITDLYTQIAQNETDITGRVLIAGDTMTGALEVEDNINITVANFLNFVAGQAILASLSVDIASNLTITAVNNLTLDQTRFFIEQFNNADNLDKVLSVTTNGEIVAVEDFASTIFSNLSVVAVTLAAGSDATASYDAETNVLTLGIPRGDMGAGGGGTFDPDSDQTITGAWVFDIASSLVWVLTNGSDQIINIDASTSRFFNDTIILSTASDSTEGINIAANLISTNAQEVNVTAAHTFTINALAVDLQSGLTSVASIADLETAIGNAGLTASIGWLSETVNDGLVEFRSGTGWTPLRDARDPLNNLILLDHFESITARDTYFSSGFILSELETGDLITVVDSETVRFYEWTGDDNPTSYDSDFWVMRSVSVPAGSVFLGGIRISEGGNALVLTNSPQNRTYLAQGIEFTDSGTVATNNVPILSAVEQAADPQLVDTDTFTGTLLEFSLPAPSDFVLKEFDLRFASAVSNVNVTVFAGTDDTGAEIVTTTFDAVVGTNTLTHDSNPRFVSGADYFIRYTTTSAALNILGDNSGASFVPYSVSRVWPYSETTAITAANITSFLSDTTDDDAIHDNVAGEINAIAQKTATVADDIVLIEDSEDSFNKKRATIQAVTTTNVTIAASNVTNDTTDQNGVLLNAANQQEVNDRLDATGIGASPVLFEGSFIATSLNQNTWYGGKQTIHMQGQRDQTNARRTYTIPGPTELNAIFDDMVTRNVSEVYTLQISYIGGSSTSIVSNALTIQAPSVSAVFDSTEIPFTLGRNQSVTLQISRSGSDLSGWDVIATGAAPSTGDVLGDIELRSEPWTNISGATLPGAGSVSQGFAFRVTGSDPNDGTIRSDLVLTDDRVAYDGDWMVWSAATFTSWSDSGNWFVLSVNDVRRITAAEANFLSNTSETDTLVRASMIDTTDDPRFLLLDAPGDYDAGNLNTNGQSPTFIQNTDQGNAYIAVRLQGTSTTLADVLSSYYIEATLPDGTSERIFNLEDDFTHQGNFSGESDYVSDSSFSYRAGTTLAVYEYNTVPQFAIANYDATPNIPDLGIQESQLEQDVQDKLNGLTPGDHADDQRVTSLESKMEVLAPLIPDVTKLTEFADVIDLERSSSAVEESTGYSLFADFRGDATRYESTGVVYTAGSGVVDYTGLGDNIWRMFGCRVTAPADQVLVWLVDGAEVIPFIDMTVGGNYRINDFTPSTTEDEIRTSEPFMTLTSADNLLTHTVGDVVTYQVNDYPASVTDTSRRMSFNAQILVNGVDTEAGVFTVVDIPDTDVAQATATVRRSAFLGPLHGSRTVIIQVSYEVRIDGSDVLVDFRLVSADSDVTIRIDNVTTDQTYTAQAAVARVDDYVTLQNEFGNYTFAGANELLVAFGPTPFDATKLRAVPVVIDSTDTVDELNDVDLEHATHPFDAVRIPDTIEFRTASPDHYHSHSELAAFIPRYVTQWVYGLALAVEIGELTVSERVDFSSNLVLISPDGTRWELSVADDGTLKTDEVI